ncbi:hypothetical protein [Nonomuraea sp. GTA35]
MDAVCESCGSTTTDLIGHHARHDLDAIVQTYQCRACDHVWNVWH